MIAKAEVPMETSSNIYKSNIIYELIQSDVYLFDAEDKNTYSIRSSEYSHFFNDFISKEINSFLQIMKKSKLQCAHYYNSSYFLCFIGICFWEEDNYEGSFIFGPFIEESVNIYDFISKYSSEMQKIGSMDTISSFYSGLKIYSSNKHDKLISLLYSFFINKLAKQDTNYIKSHTPHSQVINDKFNIFDGITYWKKHYDEENLLLKYIERGDLKETLEILNNISLSNTSKTDTDSFKRTKDLLTLTNSTLTRKSIKENVPLEVAYTISNKYGYIIQKNANNVELMKLFTQMFIEYLELIKKYKIKKYSILINKAIAVIHEHQTDPITLTDIANKLKVSSAHLSRKFKADTNMTITDYIHKTKIDLAIELMKIKSYSILEISLSLGYLNYSHFHKWFKKFTGVSPKLYDTNCKI